MTTELNYKAEDNTDRVFDVVIVGAGVAGMTAAIYARRAFKSVLVIDEKTHGGQILQTNWIRNWPGEENISGKELTDKIYHQAHKLGASYDYATIDKIEKDGEIWKLYYDDNEYFRGRSVILAIGSVEKKMGIPNELDLIGKGVSYCATCDGGLYHDKTVIVVGGGNTALWDALYLADIASKVYIVHRREEFRGDEAILRRLEKKKNVEYVMGFQPVEVIGDTTVTGLKVKNDGTERIIGADGIFVAIGRVPDTEKFADLVDLDENGYIVAGEDCHTSQDGIFVAGDCRTKVLRQLVTAAADGAVAASEAIKYLSE